jgi:hypothetical protein
MKNEKPILFNSEMVRAILEGRKTQTRRPLIAQPNDSWAKNPHVSWNAGKQRFCWASGSSVSDLVCPLGGAGGNLWVRETFADTHDVPGVYCPGLVYRATDPEWSEMEGFKWTPSIHMPRESSRIDLKVKRVWVQRIQDISVPDCIQEGIKHDATLGEVIAIMETGDGDDRHKETFADLWESCGYDWDSNPFVWCCDFEVCK